MKADRFGTGAERQRAHVRWTAPTERTPDDRKQAGCKRCRHYRDDAFCTNPVIMLGTRANAICELFSKAAQ